MIDSTLDFKIPLALFQINHNDSLLFFGSCFSDEIGDKAKFYGFNALSNPFGTIFHPAVILRNIKKALEQEQLNKKEIVEHQGVYFSWDTSGKIFGYSEEELIKRYNEVQIQFKDGLLKSKVLFITFGTAFGYNLKTEEYVVANCHKQPSTIFNKRLYSVHEMLNDWLDVIKLLKDLNPLLEIVFTVSPVRHIKDGLIENNRSKSVLIDLVNQLTSKSDTHYFPSYEIMVDELRDYRYYKLDKIHPSDEALSYIWKRFSESYFNDETISINQKVEKLKLCIRHKTLYKESHSYKLFQDNLNAQLQNFKEEYPNIALDF